MIFANFQNYRPTKNPLGKNAIIQGIFLNFTRRKKQRVLNLELPGNLTYGSSRISRMSSKARNYFFS